MKLKTILVTALLAMTAVQGTTALPDDPLQDPTGPVAETDPLAPLDPMLDSHDHDGELTTKTVSPHEHADLDCHGHDKLACAVDDPDGPWLPASAMTTPSEELCTMLRTNLDPEMYEIVGAVLCDEEKEPEPLPEPPVPPPDVFVETQEQRYTGFDGADLFLRASYEIQTQGITLQGDTTINASARIQTGEPPAPEPGQVPCSDPRGCPDLHVDELQMLRGDIVERSFPASSCAVQEGSTQPGDRRLLRFTFTAPNLGHGDLVIGAPEDHPQWFEWGECHEHWHFESFADYRLWTPQGYAQWQNARNDDPDATAREVLDNHPGLEKELVASHKQAFCLIDIRSYLPFPGPNYRSCSSNQGISSGWADEYQHHLDGQWVDVTDTAPGLYVLEAEVNPERVIQESDYSNNAGALLVAIPLRTLPNPPIEPPVEPPEVPEIPEDDLECDDCRPDLSVDEVRLLQNMRQTTETFSASDCNVEEGSTQAGTRQLIRFATKIPNTGNASLSIGDPTDEPDLFEWGDCHGHWHYQDFVDHRLWNHSAYLEWRELRDAQPERPAQETLDEHPHLRDGLVAGHKQGFCLIDIERAFIIHPQNPRHHTNCSNQGISAGWADVYTSSLDGQFIDVTDVPPGAYVLELEVNPGRTVMEARYDNNAAAVPVVVQ